MEQDNGMYDKEYEMMENQLNSENMQLATNCIDNIIQQCYSKTTNEILENELSVEQDVAIQNADEINSLENTTQGYQMGIDEVTGLLSLIEDKSKIFKVDLKKRWDNLLQYKAKAENNFLMKFSTELEKSHMILQNKEIKKQALQRMKNEIRDLTIAKQNGEKEIQKRKENLKCIQDRMKTSSEKFNAECKELSEKNEFLRKEIKRVESRNKFGKETKMQIEKEKKEHHKLETELKSLSLQNKTGKLLSNKLSKNVETSKENSNQKQIQMQKLLDEKKSEFENLNLNHENKMKLQSNALVKRENAKAAAIAKKQEYEDYEKNCDLTIAEKKNSLTKLYSQQQENEEKMNAQRCEIANLKTEIEAKRQTSFKKQELVQEITDTIRMLKDKYEILQSEINQATNKPEKASKQQKMYFHREDDDDNDGFISSTSNN